MNLMKIYMLMVEELMQKILNNLKDFKKYDEERNSLELNTTHLSAYIKFGCVSIREVY